MGNPNSHVHLFGLIALGVRRQDKGEGPHDRDERVSEIVLLDAHGVNVVLHSL